MIRVGDVEIDLTGSQKEVDAEMMNIREGEEWSTAIAKVRSARETAIAAAVEAAKKSGMPERGSAFRSLIENSSLTKKPDQVLAAIQYLREVEGLDENISNIEIESFQAMIERATAEFPNFKVTATTLRTVKTASINDWGAICWSKGEFHQATHRVGLEILDRVGGGDSFASGLIYGLLTTNDPARAVEYGAAHGALAAHAALAVVAW